MYRWSENIASAPATTTANAMPCVNPRPSEAHERLAAPILSSPFSRVYCVDTDAENRNNRKPECRLPGNVGSVRETSVGNRLHRQGLQGVPWFVR